MCVGDALGVGHEQQNHCVRDGSYLLAVKGLEFERRQGLDVALYTYSLVCALHPAVGRARNHKLDARARAHTHTHTHAHAHAHAAYITILYMLRGFTSVLRYCICTSCMNTWTHICVQATCVYVHVSATNTGCVYAHRGVTGSGTGEPMKAEKGGRVRKTREPWRPSAPTPRNSAQQ